MEIPFNVKENGQPVTIIQWSKFPFGTKDREDMENYLITESSKLTAFELTTREKIPTELN